VFDEMFMVRTPGVYFRRLAGILQFVPEASMKAISKSTFLVLGLWLAVAACVSLKAQETGAITSSGQDALTSQMDNGARPGDSHVRIVRLSDAKGHLGLDRKTGAGFEQTMSNMPIVQGERLATADGYAEVEFEDNSTLRVAPNTEVSFPLLALRSTGAKASTMKVAKGIVYVSTESTKDNEFLLEAGDAKMVVGPSTHLRLDFDGDAALLAVFNGSVEVQRGDETTVVNKKETLSLAAGQMSVTKKIAEGSFDAWDKESAEYHERYSHANAFAGNGNSFGLSDLNYYGNFVNVPGYGSFWQPYFIGAGWSPYANGVWALYPGAGYSWVSPYPWGWLPYHSGAWSFVPGFGWGWQPGSSFNGLNNVAMTNGAIGGGSAVAAAGTVGKGVVHSPMRPAVMPQAPTTTAAARQSLVLSNEKPIVFSKEERPGNFVFQKDSAGLGVPRGSLGNLNKISNDVGRHGSANMEVYAANPHPGMERGGDHGANRPSGPATLRPASRADESTGYRGGNEAAAAMRQGGGNPQSNSGQASPSYHGGGGGTSPAPMSAPAPAPSAAGGAGARGPVAAPR